MNQDKWDEIRQRKKDQKCICKDCEDCFHYRNWPATDKTGQIIGIRKGCTIEVLGVILRSLIGSVDGAQGAINSLTNADRAMKEKINQFGNAAVKTLDKIADNIPKLLEK